MTQAVVGDTVRFHFTGKLADGTQFETTTDRGPLDVQLGQGQLLPAIEDALVGMTAGEKKSLDVAPTDAFGERRDDLIHIVGRDQIPSEVELTVGRRLTASNANGEQIDLLVVAMDGDSVTLDANHPLAGMDLVFELEMLEIL